MHRQSGHQHLHHAAAGRDTGPRPKHSFDSYIKPIEVRNALGFVLTNDPRPFFAHQSNLADDGILYPVVQGVLDQYKAVYDTTKTPLLHLDLKEQGQALTQMDHWASAQSGVNAYIDRSGIHVSAVDAPAVPITVPTGSTVTGGSLSPYAGEQSGWITAPATDTVVAVPPIPAGGYLTVPAAPTIGTATAGNASATVSWTAPTDTGGAPITGYTVQAFAGTSTTAAATVTAAAEATSLTVPGLTNGTGYTFTVAATNAAGTGPASAASNSVTPAAPPAAPTIGTATAGNASATVSWTAPHRHRRRPDHRLHRAGLRRDQHDGRGHGHRRGGGDQPDRVRADQRHQLHLHRRGDQRRRHRPGLGRLQQRHPGRRRRPRRRSVPPPPATPRPP